LQEKSIVFIFIKQFLQLSYPSGEMGEKNYPLRRLK
jgi:hypothetical protein